MNPSNMSDDYARETVLSERDAKRLVELLDRSASWNARLSRSLDAYQAATGGNPNIPFEWQPTAHSDPGRRR